MAFFIYSMSQHLKNKITMKNYLVFFFTLFFLTGCYPIYKKIRPFVSLQVYDHSGQYIKGVTVVRMTNQYPARVDTVFESQKTDTQGMVKFKGQRKWAIEFMMIHGAQDYTWNICLSKPGYETVNYFPIDNDVDLKLTLKETKTAQKACYQSNF